MTSIAELKISANERRDGRKTVIAKFGSSVLRDVDDLSRVMVEIYRHVRKGERVVAVVSAFAGETDRLFELVGKFGSAASGAHAPRVIGSGEAYSAALLALACDEAGLATRLIDESDLNLIAQGDRFEARPVSVDGDALRGALDGVDVVVVPGFVALSETGAPVLLGRGGTDMSAMVLAAALGEETAYLIKDVNGVYDKDPAVHQSTARRFETISYEGALDVAGKLVQSDAIRYAQDRGVAISVGRAGGANHTVIGGETAMGEGLGHRAPLKVALAGCGVVGVGVAQLLDGFAEDFEVVGVLVRDLRKKRPASLASAKFVTDADALLALKPDVIVDVLSSGDLGLAVTEKALAAGVGIVSANKQALADHLPALRRSAAETGAALEFSSAVGGGCPIIETVRRLVERGDEIVRIEAVVNGTVNYILTELSRGKDFDDAVKAAQIAGFAEADPTADLTGSDAVAKAKILSWEAHDAPILGEIPCEALDADKRAEVGANPGVWRQITTVDKQSGAVTGSVKFEKIAGGDFFDTLDDERNGGRITLASGEVVTVKGRGAGPTPTAHAIFGDLGHIRRSA